MPGALLNNTLLRPTVRYLLPLSLFLLLQTTHSIAQTASFSKVYVGVQAFAGNYTLFYPRETSSRLLASKPLELDAGFRFTPQWAIQLGWIGSKQTSRNAGEYVNTTGKTISYASRDEQSNMAFPVLLRYTVTHKPARRVQFDVSAGITIVRASYHEQATRLDDGQVAYTLDQANRAINALFTVGPSIRCALGKYVELTGMSTVNKSLHSGGSQSGLSPTVSAGLHYRFAGK